MLTTHSSPKREDRYDIRWVYTHPGRCHLCGCLIIAGDKIQIAELIETFTVEYGYDRRTFRAQWHLSCVRECLEQ